ncbi:hypothetical protein XENOCAPTIV_008123 [Xenoophorus captivus]|uniref:Uncharacterized protein n=1 Tax=Xenoophorus captivus TaxID=1517983 RepID=A0ABV0RHZ3_9TELE
MSENVSNRTNYLQTVSLQNLLLLVPTGLTLFYQSDPINTAFIGSDWIYHITVFLTAKTNQISCYYHVQGRTGHREHRDISWWPDCWPGPLCDRWGAGPMVWFGSRLKTIHVAHSGICMAETPTDSSSAR